MFDHSQPKGRDLAELESEKRIIGYILDNAVTITHNRQSFRLFNATHMPISFCRHDPQTGIHIVGRVDGSGYVAKSVPVQQEQVLPSGLTVITTNYVPTDEIVYRAMVTAQAEHQVYPFASDEYRSADGYRGVILNPIKIRGYEELWVYYWNKFAIPTPCR